MKATAVSAMARSRLNTKRPNSAAELAGGSNDTANFRECRSPGLRPARAAINCSNVVCAGHVAGCRASQIAA